MVDSSFLLPAPGNRLSGGGGGGWLVKKFPFALVHNDENY